MKKTILRFLITGSTDGIGLETAKVLVSEGHHVLLHGRDACKLEKVIEMLATLPGSNGQVEGYVADLCKVSDIEALASAIASRYATIDVLINNAGICKSANPTTMHGIDVRFMVNTLAPYLLTRRLLPLLGPSGRVINVSSAAQAPVDVQALTGQRQLEDFMTAYAQSKLAMNMWSRDMALSLKDTQGGPSIVSVNPGSLLGSKTVKEGFGVPAAEADIRIGANVLCRASLDDEKFTAEVATGQYFDNDCGEFSSPHPDGLDPNKTQQVVNTIQLVLAEISLAEVGKLTQ